MQMSPRKPTHDARGLGLAESLVADVTGLVSPPGICLKLAELVQSPDSSVQAFAEVIIRDPNLTARLLRLVNSSFYGLRTPVDTVSRAIAMVGTRDLYTMALAISAVKSFSRIPNPIINMDTFWRHSIYTALIARILAMRCRVLHPERLFIAGLLHDIGIVVLCSRLPDLARDLLLIARGDEELYCAVEMDELGFSHADLGALLLRNWNLPETLIETVALHHRPAVAVSAKVDTAIVHIANVLANRSGIGAYCEEIDGHSAIDEAALAALGLGPANLDESEVTGEAGLQFAQTAAVLAA